MRLESASQLFVQPAQKYDLIRAIQLAVQCDDGGRRSDESQCFRFIKSAARNVQDTIAIRLYSFERIERKIGAGNGLCEFRGAWLNAAAVGCYHSRRIAAQLWAHAVI